MPSKLLFSALAVAFLGASTAISSAYAADDVFCKDYATTAVNQTRSAVRHSRCDGYLRNEARWHESWRNHYDWCRTVSRDKAWFERNERKHALERCTR